MCCESVEKATIEFIFVVSKGGSDCSETGNMSREMSTFQRVQNSVNLWGFEVLLGVGKVVFRIKTRATWSTVEV